MVPSDASRTFASTTARGNAFLRAAAERCRAAPKARPAFALGEAFTGQLYNRSAYGGQCQAWAPAADSETDRFLAKGADIGPNPLAEVTLQVAGTGRLQQRGATDPYGEFLRVDRRLVAFSGYADTEKDEDCNPIWTSEGLVRCVASDAIEVAPGYSEYFSDDQCTQPTPLCTNGICGDVAILFEPGVDYVRRASAVVRVTPTDGVYTEGMPGAIFGEQIPWAELPQFGEHNSPFP